VVVDEGWHVKLLDVELSGLRGERLPRAIGGGEAPQEYLALEQIRRSAVTEETDVYGFGVMLYEMLAGAPPFQAKTRDALLKKQVAESPLPLRRRRRAVPAAVDSIVALTLSKRPERRPTIQTVLNCLWQEVNRPAKRWKRTAAITAGIALAASIPVLVGWSLFARESRMEPPSLVQPAPGVSPAAIETSPDRGSAPGAIVSEPPPAPPIPAAPTAREAPRPPSSTASRTPTSGRRDQTERSQNPPNPASDRAPSSNSNDDPDPGAVVDWLLERAGKRPK